MTSIGIIGDEATITGFLLAGAGCISSDEQRNFYVVGPNTPKKEVEVAFEDLRSRTGIEVILASNSVMETLKDVIAECDLHGKVLMPFPTKDSGLFQS